MNKILLVLSILLIACTTLSMAQSDQTLKQASSFTVLASKYVTNTGTTGVNGNLGVVAPNAIDDQGNLFVSGTREEANAFATTALRDAAAAFETLKALPATQTLLYRELGGKALLPGVYKFDGNTNLSGILLLDGRGDINSTFVFVIKGDLTSTFPVHPTPSTGLLLQNGAQPNNIFWIVEGEARLGGSTLFQGTIIAKKKIDLDMGVGLIGRAISLTEGVNLNMNNIFLPTVVIANLGVEKVAADTDYLIGSEITYTIRARNMGPGPATGVLVEENFPASLEFVRAAPEKGEFRVDPVDGKHKWYIGDMANGETVTMQVVFKILSAGDIKNEVVIGGDNPDPDPSDNEGKDPIIVPLVGANLSVKKTASEGPYVYGDNVTYTIRVKNDGPYTAENVKVTERLSEKLQYVSSTPSKGSYDPATGIFTVGNLLKDEVAELVIVAKIVGTGNIENLATITSDTPDTNPGDDTDIVIIEIVCPTQTVAITGGASLCAGASNVTFTVTAVAGATYSFGALPAGWVLVSQTANTITVNAGQVPGKLTATVTDKCGNVYTAEKEISVTTQPAAPAMEGAASACANTREVTYTVAGDAAGTGYVWATTGGVAIVSGQGTGQVVVSIGATGGTVTVVAKNECFESLPAIKTITLTTPPATPAAITGTQTICAGGNATYRITPVAGATGYTWTVPAGWQIVSGQNTNELVVKAGTAAGNVGVSATNECGSSTGATIAVAVSEIPQAAAAIQGSASACAGANNTYSISPVAGATGYTWTVPTGWEIISGQNSTSITVKAGAAAGNIAVTASNSCGTSAATVRAVTVNDKPAAPAAIQGPATVCANASSTFSVATVGGATGYTWNIPAGWQIISGENTNQVTVRTGATGGTLTVSATNECGSSASASIVVTLTSPPQAPAAITGTQDLCAGTDATYTVSPVAGATGYTWAVPAGWQIISGQNTNSITVKAGTASGNVSVAATNACGSSAASLLAVVATDVPAAPAAIRGTTSACVGTELTFTTDAADGATGYIWSVPAGWAITSGQNTTSITVSVGTTTGNVTVAVNNRCGAGAAASVAVGPAATLATPARITGPATKCAGDLAELTYTTAAVDKATGYTWTVPAGWQIVAGAGTTSITVKPGDNSGAITVTATNDCGVSEAAALAVTVLTPPTSVGPIIDNSNVCDGLRYSVPAAAGATTYTWSVPAGFTITSGQGTGSITVRADSPTAFGDVTVVASNGNCGGPEAKRMIDKTLANGELDFPKAFSPNGDGKNDTWVVSNLDKFSDNEVVIFNRWGGEVYRNKNYQNDWAGNGLQQGTYFYKARVTVCNGVVKEFTGYTTIFR